MTTLEAPRTAATLRPTHDHDHARPDVDPAVLRTYREKGYVALRGLLSPAEVAAAGAECDRLLALDLVDPHNIRTPFRFNSGERPERIDPVLDLSPLFAALGRDERLLGPVRAIFGGDEPLLFKDKLILKAPGTDGYAMHQDQAWWQLCPADGILSVSVQIDGADAANGCIELFGGYQDRMLSPEGELRNLNAAEIATVNPRDGEKIETQPGDVLIFHSLAPHQSGKNLADKSRRSLYLSYSAASHGDLHATYYERYKSQPSPGTDKTADGTKRFFR